MLLTRSLDVLQRANFQEAENFIKRYSETPKELKELLGNNKKSHPPQAAAKNDK